MIFWQSEQPIKSKIGMDTSSLEIFVSLGFMIFSNL